jgi:hypothetical protein
MVKTMVEIEQDPVGYGSKSVTKPFSNGARLAVSIVFNYEDRSEFRHGIGDDRKDTIFDRCDCGSPPEIQLI